MSAPASPSKPERLLPALELEVMKVLWELGEATVGQVQSVMTPARPLAYTTVMTLLERLSRKGAAARRKQGRGYVYEPELTRQDAREQALDRLVQDFFDNSRGQLLAYLQAIPTESVPRYEPAPVQPLDSVLL